MDSAKVGTDGTKEGRDSVEVGTGPERMADNVALFDGPG
jgi:hypothetical protein